MATVTEGYVDAQTGRMKAELRAETLETLRRSDQVYFRQTMRVVGVLLAAIASATGVIIVALK